MKKQQLIIAVLLLLTGLAAGLYLSPNSSEPVSTAVGAADPATPTTWTCSMHPQIHQPKPGDCPICGMDLIPLMNDSGADEGPRTLSMSESSRALADIRTTVVTQDYPIAEVRLVGKLNYDETREKSLTARFPARIDELYVNFTGIPVKAGEHLAKVYSPELLSAQRELLTAYRANPDSSITQAAKGKLRLWDLLPEQIDAIIESNEAKDHFVLQAPIGGVVVAKNVQEGDYVKTGEVLFRIVDLSVLWATLDAYESDLPWLRYGQAVSYEVGGIPGETFSGSISFIEPEVNRKTRTVAVRVNVSNADGRLKPGMFVRSSVESRLAEGGKLYVPEYAGKWISPMHPEVVKDGPGPCDVCGMDLVPAESLGYVVNERSAAPIIVPASAVLRTGKRAVVYVEKMAAERPTYDGREIVLGARAGDHYIVVSGLEAGEQVVTNGAFKIDSALQIQAKPSMMNPVEEMIDPHAGHAMPVVLEINHATAQSVLPEYLEVQSSLSSDDLGAAKASLTRMMGATGHQGELPELIHQMLAAETLEAMRKPHFETLSNAMIAAVKANPEAFEGKLYVMHCPMVYPDRGADWLQSNAELLNPYWGSMMLHCGELKEEITE
ncbi:MAG: Cu(I)/Ag(I) efflux system membrane fusion protein [Lentimonas sp.]|jgi:Cu(I)/Ag(I) efflux system membrane fusion protein